MIDMPRPLEIGLSLLLVFLEYLKDKLFQPYFSTKSGGTGLGLAICKKAMDELGGEIEIESELGKGTAVTLRLPYNGNETSLNG